MPKRRVYLSGPMSGYPDYNYPLFNDVAGKLRAAGWEVFNPAENDEGSTHRPREWYLKTDIPNALACDIVAVLPGWEKSRGAKLEALVALEVGILVVDAMALTRNEGLFPVDTAWLTDILNRPPTTEGVNTVQHLVNEVHARALDAIAASEPANAETAGGTRYSHGKPAGWWYAPIYGLRLVAPVWERGAKKYAPMDWKNGQSFSTLIDCATRHLLEVLDRGPYAKDTETGCYHAAHTVWNLLALLTFIERGRTELDDVSPWIGVTAAQKREMEREEEHGPTV